MVLDLLASGKQASTMGRLCTEVLMTERCRAGVSTSDSAGADLAKADLASTELTRAESSWPGAEHRRVGGKV